MDYFSQQYFNLKNAIIKAERRILKELGFCVHVKHSHKLIITYLQILESEKNIGLARKAWNYMNDSLRTDVFVRFSPEKIACACIFLAARTNKINLPLRPPWWQLFDTTFDEIEDISLSILRLYSRPRRKITHLESAVNKIKKEVKERKTVEAKDSSGSFTPSHNPTNTMNNNNSKPSSKSNAFSEAEDLLFAKRTDSPNGKSTEKRPVLSSIISSSKTENNDKFDRKRDRRQRERSESEYSSEYSSDSGAELPSKKYAQQRKQYENKKRRSSSVDSNPGRHTVPSKFRRSASPVDRRNKSKDNRVKYRDSNGEQIRNSYKSNKRRSRSRSPVKRRSVSPSRKDKYPKDKSREKIRSKDKYYDKYSHKVRR